MNAGFLARRGVITRHPVDFFPERCAWGSGTELFQAGVESFVLLYNDDALGRFLRVYFVWSLSQGVFTQPSIRVYNGVQGTFAMQGQPLVTNMGVMSGSIYTGTSATEFGTEYGFGAVQFVTELASPFPIIVLAPGWSLVNFGGAAANSVAGSFIWMVD